MQSKHRWRNVAVDALGGDELGVGDEDRMGGAVEISRGGNRTMGRRPATLMVSTSGEGDVQRLYTNIRTVVPKVEKSWNGERGGCYILFVQGGKPGGWMDRQ